MSDYDVTKIREDFPILGREVHGRPLVYLDSAASSQRPRAVIETISRYYETSHANIHRAVHALAEEATQAYEGAREKVRRFLGAREAAEIVFVRGTTEAINLVAQSFARPRLGPGDEVLVTHLEHHSNIVPWQLVCQATGARLVVAPIDLRGEVDLEGYRKRLSSRTRLVGLSHVSNALGTVNPIESMIADARSQGARVLIDGAQAVPHFGVDVAALDCDFYAFSGHKVYGPTGIGALYGRRELLEAMEPYQGGGEMIATVSFEGSTWNAVPHKFEAGTPAIAAAVGLGAAMDYVTGLGLERVRRHEDDVLAHATGLLEKLPGVRVIGTSPCKAGVLSFVVEGVHPHDVGTVLDREGVAVRTGHHCAQPVMDFFGVPATTRASFGCYNTRQEGDALAEGLERVLELFA